MLDWKILSRLSKYMSLIVQRFHEKYCNISPPPLIMPDWWCNDFCLNVHSSVYHPDFFKLPLLKHLVYKRFQFWQLRRRNFIELIETKKRSPLLLRYTVYTWNWWNYKDFRWKKSKISTNCQLFFLIFICSTLAVA